jgi:hypothetical protein
VNKLSLLYLQKSVAGAKQLISGVGRHGTVYNLTVNKLNQFKAKYETILHWNVKPCLCYIAGRRQTTGGRTLYSRVKRILSFDTKVVCILEQRNIQS